MQRTKEHLDTHDAARSREMKHALLALRERVPQELSLSLDLLYQVCRRTAPAAAAAAVGAPGR